MCCRYVFDDYKDEMYQDELDRMISKVRLGEFRPSQMAPVIATNTQGITTAFPMIFGYKAFNNNLVFNARSETASAKPMFSDGMKHRRCLLPANCYYEWRKKDGETTRFTLSHGHLIYLAGLYRLEDDGPKFTILTRESATHIAFIHPRMPVILPASALESWLSQKGDPDRILESADLNVEYKVS